MTVEARSPDAALYHAPSRSNRSYIAWRCALGQCPVEKQMMILRTGWDGMSLQKAVVAMLLRSDLI